MRAGKTLGFAIAFLIGISSRTFAGTAEWEPVPPTDGKTWIAYRGSALERAARARRDEPAQKLGADDLRGGGPPRLAGNLELALSGLAV